MKVLRLEWIIGFYFLLHSICCSDIQKSDTWKNKTLWCDFYTKVFPEQDKVNEECSFEINSKDLDTFDRKLKQLDYQVSFLKLKLKFSDEVEVDHTRCTIKSLNWVWTYKGDNGGEPFLHMLKGWSFYSFGLLDFRSMPMDIHVHKVGNCTVTIGERNTTERLGLTFLNSINKIYRQTYKVDIETAYICYLSSIIGDADSWSSPIFVDHRQLLGYRCCRSQFNEMTKNDTVVCESNILLTLNNLWWDFPFYVAVSIQMYSPLFIIYILGKAEKCYNNRSLSEKWIAVNPFTFSKICEQIQRKTFGVERMFSCFFKIGCVLSSFSILGIVILCYREFPDLHSLLLDGIKSGVFFTWKSMAAGYSLSKDNYLPWCGGPYVALGLYIVTSSLMLCLPADLRSFLDKGFQDSEGLSNTLLTVDTATKARLGGVQNFHRKTGFTKLYDTLKANCSMLVNPTFWIFGINLQKRRFTAFLHLDSQRFLSKIFILFTIFPVYACVCVIEWILAVIFYGAPMFGVCVLVVKAFRSSFVHRLPSNTLRAKFVKFICVVVVSLCLLFDYLILCTIFVESFVFLCDVAVNTFSGLIAFPEVTYSYSILVITVVMYVTESIQHVGKIYNGLMDKLKKISQTITPEQRCGIALVKFNAENQCLYVSERLFRYVVQYYKPLRIQLLFSLIRVVIIAIVLYISISNLLVFNKINRMGSLTQVITSIFICLIPKLFGKFTKSVDKSHDINETQKIRQIVLSFCITSLSDGRVLHDVVGTNEQSNENTEEHGQLQSSSESLNELLLDIDM